jgi:quinol monooxygenase YgiN
MLVLHASFPIDPDRREEALDIIDTLVDKSNEKDGMIAYRAAVDVQDEKTIRFFEEYEDEAAYEAHGETDHLREFKAELPDLLAGEPEVRRFEVSEATDLEL